MSKRGEEKKSIKSADGAFLLCLLPRRRAVCVCVPGKRH